MMKIHFLGVRGSTPCADSRYSKYGGHTSCIMVEADDQVIIFDAGSGIINASKIALTQEDKTCHLFFSHVHLDHMMGLPFFTPLWVKDFTTHIWAGSLAPYGGIGKFLTDTLSAPLFPVPFTAFPGNIICSDFTAGTTQSLGRIDINTFELNHPNGAVAYRLNYNSKSVCYVTDHEHGEGANQDSLIEFIKGADIFIYDSSYSDESYEKYKGWGHSTWQEALRLGEKANVAKTYLFHHDPQNTDDKMTIVEEEVLKASHRAAVSRQDTVIML